MTAKTSFLSLPVAQFFTRRTKTAEDTARRVGRRLPTRRLWPWWAITAVQFGIFIGFLALWEIAADKGLIDAFFWSQPSAIASTFVIFFANGEAFTDIGYTFRSTIFGFALGTSLGAMLGLSFWWSQNYARIVQPLIICLESIPKLALAPLIILVFGLGLASKVAIATALTLVVSTLTTYAGRTGGRSGPGEIVLFARRQPPPGLHKTRRTILCALDHFDPAGQYRACLDGGDRRRIRCFPVWIGT